MGFRTRILAAFGILGLLPLLVVGAFGYTVSARLLQDMASAHGRINVERVARQMELRGDIESSVSWITAKPGPEIAKADPNAPLTRTFLVDRDLRRVAPISEGAPPTTMETALALDAVGDVAQASSGDRVVGVDDQRWLVAYAALSNPRWAVVSLGSLDALTGLWSRVKWTYMGFVALVALITGLALSFLVRPILRTLEDLTEATNLIGEGELTPWLPARSEGEVGRLSLATGAMVERVERMMQAVGQGARMAMVGQLATYLAHEIRNPLSSIRLNLQSISRELKEGRIPSDVGEVTEICLHEIARLDKVASSVLQVGRRHEGSPIRHHLHDPLRHAASLLESEMSRRRISLYLDTLADHDDVFADREGLEGVFLNLLMNAAESIGEEGAIRVVSRTLRDDEGRGWIRIEFEDTGPGVPDGVRDRIFDPFYTTKVDGTGIGLATALETVRAHGGQLSLATPPDQLVGALFVMELPLQQSDIPAHPPQEASCPVES
jgi:signal transduction histidine kinase